MDEATSSLDFETDQLLKRFVSEHFKECTVLTIAHRLNTILDADRIMVFEAGKLVEFDTPKKLLSDPNGYLTWLVQETNSAGRIHQLE
jgi:ABC-type multidrug transport system fused ATPase/permease subunit